MYSYPSSITSAPITKIRIHCLPVGKVARVSTPPTPFAQNIKNCALLALPRCPLLSRRPPGNGGGIKGSISFHCSWVRLVEYDLLLLGNDLYSRQPMCELVTSLGFHYIFTCLPESHIALYEWLKYLDTNGEVSHQSVRVRHGRKWHFYNYRCVPLSLANPKGKKYLASFLLTLNLLAFLFHTVLHLVDLPYQQIRSLLGTRKRFFND